MLAVEEPPVTQARSLSPTTVLLTAAQRYSSTSTQSGSMSSILSELLSTTLSPGVFDHVVAQRLTAPSGMSVMMYCPFSKVRLMVGTSTLPMMLPSSARKMEQSMLEPGAAGKRTLL